MGLGTIKWIAIGVTVALVVGYIGFLKLEVNHYRTKADDIQAQFSLVVHTQAVKLAATEAAVKTQSEALAAETKQASETISGLMKSNLQEIKKHEKELASCKLPDVTRSLFNDPNGTTGPDQKDSASKTVAGNDAGTPTLEKLLEANEVNKANFNLMREIILKWQKKNTQDEANLNGN